MLIFIILSLTSELGPIEINVAVLRTIFSGVPPTQADTATSFTLGSHSQALALFCFFFAAKTASPLRP